MVHIAAKPTERKSHPRDLRIAIENVLAEHDDELIAEAAHEHRDATETGSEFDCCRLHRVAGRREGETATKIGRILAGGHP